MTALQFFFGEHSRYPHEFDQLHELADAVAASDLAGPVYLVSNFLLANGEVDCLLIMPHGLVILDFKAYRGTVDGVEEGDWRVISPDGTEVLLPINLFRQLRTLRYDLIRRLFRMHDDTFPQIDEDDLRKVSAWGYFQVGSIYPPGQVNLDRVRWFDVVTVETLIERLHLVHAGFTIGEAEMDAIVRELRVGPSTGVGPAVDTQPSRPVSPLGTPPESFTLEQALVERMDALVARMEAIPRAIADLAHPDESCTSPTPGPAPPGVVAGGCSDAIGPDESTGSLAERVRRFVCTEYATPARREGHAEFSVTSGEVHRAMGLSNQMPSVCGALRSRRLEEDCSIELDEEIRSVRVRENSSTNRFVFKIR